MVKVRRHFINLLILVFLWIASSFNQYLTVYYLKYLPGDFFVNTITTNAADIPFVLLCGVAYRYMGAKYSLFSAFIAATVGSVGMILFSV